MEHLDCLLGCRVIGVLNPKFFHNPSRFNLRGFQMKKFRYRRGLFRRKQALAQFDLAQMRLVHLRSSRNNSQRQLLGLAQSSEPLTETEGGRRLGGFESSH